MADQWQKYTIYATKSFELRRPVLAATSSLQNRWRVIDDGKTLELDLRLSIYTPHERDILEFAINPLVMGANIFDGLDHETQLALATAIYQIFG
jgi:hypothetical protein